MFDAQNEKQFAEFLDTLADYTNREFDETDAERAADFIDYNDLRRAVAAQLVGIDDWSKATPAQYAEAVGELLNVRSAADGVPNFIYYSDTEKFGAAHINEIIDWISDNFGASELAEFAKRAAESGNFLNFAAWYALELVAVDLRNELNF